MSPKSASIIPVIDLAPIYRAETPCSAEWAGVAAQLESSLTRVGFVYLVNHGIDSRIVESALERSRSFFQLPVETKLQYIKGSSATAASGAAEFHGYAPPSKEILSPGVTAELRESFDIDRKVVAPEKYPNSHVPGFQSALTTLESHCRPLILQILKLLAIALKLDDFNYFVRVSKCIENPDVASYTAFRSNYYPSVEENEPGTIPVPADGSVVRCGEHTDYGIITLLFQDEIGGLEIRQGAQKGEDGGEWIQVPPVPGTVLMNTGDMLQFWSGGRFPATWHRVRVPETALQRRVHRQSIVYFVFPDDETKISSLMNADTDTDTKDDDQKAEISAFDYATDRILKSYKY